MQVEHLTVFIEQGYTWVVELLYNSSDLKSECRQYMDSEPFKEFYLSRVLRPVSFADLYQLSTLLRYGTIAPSNMLALAKKCNWNHAYFLFEEVLYDDNLLKHERLIFELLLHALKHNQLGFLELFAELIDWTFSSTLYIKLLYRLSLVDLQLLGRMPKYDGNIAGIYINKTEYTEQLFALNDRLYHNRLNYILKQAHKLSDLTTIEGRRAYKEGVGCRYPLHGVIDLSQYYTFLTYAKTRGDYNKRVLHLEREVYINLSDFNDEHCQKLNNFVKTL